MKYTEQHHGENHQFQVVLPTMGVMGPLPIRNRGGRFLRHGNLKLFDRSSASKSIRVLRMMYYCNSLFSPSGLRLLVKMRCIFTIDASTLMCKAVSDFLFQHLCIHLLKLFTMELHECAVKVGKSLLLDTRGSLVCGSPWGTCPKGMLPWV